MSVAARVRAREIVSGLFPDRAPDSFHLKFLARQAPCRLYGKTEHVVTGISPAAAELHDG